MKGLKFIILFLVIFVVVFGYLLIRDYFRTESLDQKRQKNISEMEELINKAMLTGDYKCCISPPCKMCFLGDWIWQDGRCDCDTEMVLGDWDNVCPECKKGVKEGRCSSSKAPGTCIIN